LIRSLVWSADALDDLDSAVRYIAEDNPIAARSVAAEIREAGKRLGEMATGRPGRRTGTYEKVVTGLPYILAYALHEYPDIGDAVVILRVIHTSRDWPI
jgi:plasmid stabilization system protein ParE